MGGKTHDLAGLLPVAKAVSSKGRGAVEGGSCLERRQMMCAGTRQREEPAATSDGGKWDRVGARGKEPRGEGRGGKGQGEPGEAAPCTARPWSQHPSRPVSADGFAVVHSSSMKHCLWQEGISFSSDFSLLCFLW